MRIIISMFLGSMLLCSGAFAGKIITVTKTNGNSNGLFMNVAEKHPDPDDDKDVSHSLDCKNPGTKQCKWSVNPYAITTQDDAETIVEGQITSHNYSGEIPLSGGSITWEGSNRSNYSYTITEN
jgi:hypothetical protein